MQSTELQEIVKELMDKNNEIEDYLRSVGEE